MIESTINVSSDYWESSIFFELKFESKNQLLAIIANSDLWHGLEFDCYQEASPVRGARPLIGLNLSCI